MLSAELKAKIQEAFNDPFIGNSISFTEQDLCDIYDEVNAIIIRKLSSGVALQEYEYELFALAFVELTKEWGEDDDTWFNHILKKINGNSDNRYKTTIQNLMYEFTDALGKKGRIFLLDNYRKKYYATMCSHAFAPKKSIFSLFDICWESYFKDLQQQYQNDPSFLQLIAKSLISKFSSINSEAEEQVKIGSEVYSFRIGIRGLAIQHPDLLIKLLDITFTSIHQVMNNIPFKADNYFKTLFKEWWEVKQTRLGQTKDKKSSSYIYIASDYSSIRSKFTLNEGVPSLLVSPFRLNEFTLEEPTIEIYIGEKLVKSEKIPTFSGSGLFYTTKGMEYCLDDFELTEKIDIRVLIRHDGKEIYSSKNSLYRPFIIFSNYGKEVNSKTIIPGSYFLYTTADFKYLKHPDDIHRRGKRLYSFSALEGEVIRYNDDIVFFSFEEVNKDIYLIAKTRQDLTFRKNGLSYKVVDGDVNLCVKNAKDIANIGIRYEDCSFSLKEFDNYESSNGHIFNITSIADPSHPVSITIFRYSDNYIFEVINIIKLPNIEVSFDKPLYYDDGVDHFGKVLVQIDNLSLNKEFSIHDEEYYLNFIDGELLFSPPLLRWKFDDGEFNIQPIKPIFYNDISNSTILKVKAPIGLTYMVGLTSIKSQMVETSKDGQYKFGQLLHSSISSNDLEEATLYIRCNEKLFELARIILKPQFINEPISIDSEAYLATWNPSSYLGDKCDFKLRIFDKNKQEVSSLDLTSVPQSIELNHLEEDSYELEIVMVKRGLFRSEVVLFKKDFHLGNIKNINLKSKVLKIDRAKFFSSGKIEEIKTLYIDQMRYLGTTDDGFDYYSGRLFIEYKGQKTPLDYLRNKITGEAIKINPIRIEMRTKYSCFLGYDLSPDDPEDYNEFLIARDRKIMVSSKAGSGETVDYFVFSK